MKGIDSLLLNKFFSGGIKWAFEKEYFLDNIFFSHWWNSVLKLNIINQVFFVLPVYSTS